MFWESLEQLRGARTGLPGFTTTQGREVIFWLAHVPEGAPLKELYRSSRLSEPTIRSGLHRLVDEGFVSLRASDHDLRQVLALPTPKLLDALAAYRALFAKAYASAPCEMHSSTILSQEERERTEEMRAAAVEQLCDLIPT